MSWQQVPSPNRYVGRGGHAPEVVVVHYTAGSGNALATAALFADPKRKASAHFVVGRDGAIVQCVDLEDAAWHAGDGGRSRFPSTAQLHVSDFVALGSVPSEPRSVNRRSIGIELCNRGFAPRGPNPYVTARHRNPSSKSTRWESYTDRQLDALHNLTIWLTQEISTLRWVTGHEDVTNRHTLGTIGGKVDPGPAFPWLVVPKLARVLFDFDRIGWARPAAAKECA